ncbi:RNA-directed DNA polymerase [Lujinxingia vulgaris]|uniref:RNA-directed DNA polymerase n=1 Tax=Lujinxingia vulgaris TaxID=2600176 RepID=A0A5C6XIX8_9DELT|nr:reverse transcriptase family protein [Lujinxingia vulgaris]TXD37222.1 RNA-directed DNA polymerase [Lujinxingia vulgaris]
MNLWQRLRDWMQPAPSPEHPGEISICKEREPPSPGFNRRFTTSMRSARHDELRRRTRSGRLRRLGLPVWRCDDDLARALGLTTSALYHFACHRLADPHFHYVSFTIPKRSGEERPILAPKPRLKAIQRDLLDQALSRLPVHRAAHAFVPGRSIATNARPHLRREFLLTLDLHNFFGALHVGRVRGFLMAMGYGWEVASTLALLCTEAPRQTVLVHGERLYTPTGSRTLPQGAPTSPVLANAIAYRLDRRLSGLARSLGLNYTRYADDLSFSGDDPTRIATLMRLSHQIIREEGFEVAPSKTRIQRRGRRQQVTGVVVNQTPGAPRARRRRLRAAIHHYARACARGDHNPRRRRQLEGELAFIHMINPAQARALAAGLPAAPPAANAR